MTSLLNWLDHRTGYRSFVHEALYERIPGGARWRYVWGSTLVFAFTVQAITGVFLWMAYSPSAQTAWESVFYIQFQMQGGWLLRGIHHFMAQAMVVLLALHLLQVVIDGAYRAPREVNFWIGLVLMQLVLALSLTGYLLPWDQKGYWATQVATKLLGAVPVIGPTALKLVVGGSVYGHQTLTRFFALHAGVLPAGLIFLVVIHVYLFRRHGLHARQPYKAAETTFWPDQVLKDAVACLAVLVVVLALVFRGAFTSHEATALRGDYLGAELGAPADPADNYSAARPEWYFLFLFQFLKFFHGEKQEFIGAVVIPSSVMLLLFLMPFIGRWKLGHYFNVGFLLAIFLGITVLTGAALRDDYRNQQYHEAVADAEVHAHRVRTLAMSPTGIPPQGALTLLRSDPKTEGPRLFGRNCASCHSYADTKGQGLFPITKDTSAPNLRGFATRAWLDGLLDPAQIAGPHYFGNTKHKEGEMAGFVNDTIAEMDDAQRADLRKVVAALSAEAQLRSHAELDKKSAADIAEGIKLLEGDIGCKDCHKFREEGELGTAPELTGYGSKEWLTAFISNPAAERFYGDNNDRMPAFAEDPHQAAANRLSAEELGLIVDWIRGEWYEPAPRRTTK